MDHFIKNIEITNFKSIRHAEVKDCRRVNVFVGYPNVGKSNILEALSLFSIQNNVRDAVFLKDIVRLTKDSTIFFNGAIDKKLEIKIDNEFVAEGIYETNYLKLRFGLLSWSTVNEKVNASHSISSVPFFYERSEFQNFEYYTGKHFLKPHLDISYPQPKKYEFRKSTVHKEGDLQNLYYPFGSNLFSVIQSNILLRKEFTEVIKGYKLELYFNQTEQSFSLFKKTDAGFFEINWELIADTLQRLFFYKTAVLSNKNQILLFEEPEAHMFPPYISQLTSDIIQDKNQNQFFIATHSPFVLNDFMEDLKDDELSIYAVGLENGETTINRMTDEQVTEAYQYGIDLFFNLENYLKPEELVKQ